MAINIQKLLPPSKSGALVNLKESITKIAKPTSDILPERSLENISVIKVKIIEIDNILKGTLALEKKKLDDAKRKQSGKRREKIEEKLETKPKAETGKIKMPSLPRMGFLDWIKNFIGNIILGYFAVRLVDHLPKIIPIVKFLGKATDFVLDVGGKLLDGLVTFIDWGYKAYDSTRAFIKNLGGENFAKGFDKFISALDTAVFLTTFIAGDLLSEHLFDDSGQRQADPTKAPKPKVTTSGGGASGKPDIKSLPSQKPTVTTSQGGKPGALALPGTSPKIKVPRGIKARGGLLGLVFLIPDLINAGMLVSEGRGKDGLRTLLSAVSGVVAGMTAYSATLAGAAALGITGVGLPAAIALTLAGFGASALAGTAAYNLTDAGLKKMGLVDKDPKTGNPYKYKSGGVTRGGKTQGGPKRKISSLPARKYKRKLTPKKPSEVKISSPGSDVGGEQKLFGLFPDPFKMMQEKASEIMNPFKVIKKGGENLGDSDYFGPILAITSKILLGQKPSQEDYKNVGLGINLLVSKGIDDGKLRGGIAAFAEGGFVDPKTLEAISQGGDISDWVAKSFKEATETNAQKTLREIQENLRLRRSGGEEKTAPSAEDMGEGGGVQVSSDSPDFWLLATAAMFENSDPQGAADVAQVIYNRTQYPAWNAPTIKKAILNPNQFQPVRQYGGTGAWEKIKTKEDAIRFSKTYGKTQEQLERVAAALLNTERQQSARQFVGPRDSFRAEAYEKANNHLANETEKTRHGHTFGFEPGGAMIGQFKAGKLSAAQVNENIKGETSYSSDVGSGSGNWRFGLTGRTYMSQSGWSHAHFQSFDGSVDTLVRDGVPLIRKMASSGLKPELSDGTPILPNKNDDYYAKLIRKGQAMHTHSGRKSAFDVNMPGFPLVPFRLSNFQNDPGGGGNYATVPGSGKTVLMHMSTKMNGYAKGGFTKSYPHIAKIAEKGREFVIDADSTAAIEQTFPGFLGAINRAKYDEAIEVLRNFASYESGAQETVVVMAPPQMNNDNYEMGDSSSGISLSFGGGGDSDPFETLYQGT